jgi:hypothetical protein
MYHFLFLAAAFTLAHLLRWAAAILALAAALIVRGPLPLPVAFPAPVPFSNAFACRSLLISSSMDWITCSMLMAGHCSSR